MYRIKTKVSESDCSKNDPRDLDDCNVARGASPQICEIEVWEKLWENFRRFTVKCEVDEPEFSVETKVRDKRQNIKRDQDGNPSNYRRLRREILAGGQTQADRNNEDIKLLARQGVTHLNAQSNKNNKYKPIEIVSATTQVVAGQLYRIKTKVSESDCSKNDPRDLDDCNVAQGATPQICEIKVWEKLWQNFRRFTIKCEVDEPEFSVETKVRDSQTLGGQNQVSEGDELVVKYLEDGLSRLDGQSSHENKYKVHEVISATSQVVAGHIYRIKTKIVLSDCKKTVSTKRGQCGTLTGAQPKICDFEVFEQPWIANSRVTNVTCDNEAHSFRAKRETNHAGTGFLGNDDRRVQFELFSDFIKTYKKTYSDKKEYKYRFKVFAENLYQMRVLNTYEQGTAVYGVTKFADMTQKEFSKSLGLRTDLRNENEPPFAHAKIPDVELPTEFDWRKNGAVTPVKNQEQCGSCWAFSVTGNVEGQYAIKHDKLLEFSEQELVDCDTEDQGCNGGLMDTAYRQIEKLGGLETEQDYPYDAEDEKCHFNRSLARVQLTGALNISHNEDDMAKWLVANGPISIAINANAMQFYMGGVSHPFKFLCNPKNLDHGVLIVGYGVHTYSLFNKTLPYWIVKNSWGTSWGEQGYYRVYKGDGTCGLNQTPSSAIVA